MHVSDIKTYILMSLWHPFRGITCERIPGSLPHCVSIMWGESLGTSLGQGEVGGCTEGYSQHGRLWAQL